MDAPGPTQRRPLAAALVAPLALVGVGLVLDIVIGQVVRNVLNWPVYLDSVGTILAGALAGPIAGAATGALANLLWGVVFDDPEIMPYAITAACIGLAAAGAAYLGAFRNPLWTALAGLLTGVMAALVSAPISAYVLGGATGGGGGPVIDFLEATGSNLLQAATLQGFISDPFDKTVSFLIVWAILRVLPEPIRARFASARAVARSYRFNSRWGLALLLSAVSVIFAWVFLPAFGPLVYVPFYLAVMLSAWNGGLRPALLAMLVGVAAMLTFQSPPLGGPGLRVADWLNLCFFVLVTGLITLFTVRVERINEALEASLVEQRRSQAEVSAVVDGVVEALVLVAPDQRLLRVNHRFEELFGIPAGRVVGQRLDELRPLIEHVLQEPEVFMERVATNAADQEGRFNETFVQSWPQERQLALFSTPIKSDGRFLGRLYSFRDVTQERELDRMKTEFVSQVSHELRTPLTAIKGFTELLLDEDAGEVNGEQKEYLGIVKSNVDRLVALINDLLDISRIESGRIRLKLEPIDLAEIIRSVSTTMRPLIEGKDQTLALEVEPDLPPARGDHDRVVQVLTNLISNAYKYTPAGGALRVEAGRRDGLLHVAVTDNGIGIPAEDVPKLFTRFFRVDSSLTREIGGTGLGLSIVKSIVELHGGTISVDSEPGKGSTFDFALPIAAAVPAAGVSDQVSGVSANGAAPTAEPRPPTPTAAEPPYILVVDDDRAVAERLAEQLVGAGYRAETAIGAEAALARLSERRPELVAIGVGLTGGHGFETARRLVEAPAGRDIPLLVLSIDREAAGGAVTAAAALDQRQVLRQVRRALAASGARRVLVIEDDAAIRQLLAVTLRNEGFEPMEAADGETGLAMARERAPDLVLLDMRLPGIDGLAVLQRLKRAPETAEIPVIAMTGSDGLWLGARARVLSLGAVDFVSKPFEMDALLAEIRTLTYHKERETERVDSSAGR
jgi:PAS domain S-box-containing protein